MIKPILEGSRRRYEVAASEVDHQEQWQRAGLGFAAVSGSTAQIIATLDSLERFIWSFPEVEVLSIERTWADD